MRVTRHRRICAFPWRGEARRRSSGSARRARHAKTLALSSGHRAETVRIDAERASLGRPVSHGAAPRMMNRKCLGPITNPHRHLTAAAGAFTDSLDRWQLWQGAEQPLRRAGRYPCSLPAAAARTGESILETAAPSRRGTNGTAIAHTAGRGMRILAHRRLHLMFPLNAVGVWHRAVRAPVRMRRTRFRMPRTPPSVMGSFGGAQRVGATASIRNARGGPVSSGPRVAKGRVDGRFRRVQRHWTKWVAGHRTHADRR